LRLYDCLKVKCVKECSEACCLGFKQSVIEDLTAQNTDLLARLRAVEAESEHLKHFLSLFSWSGNKGESFESTVNKLRQQLLDTQSLLDAKIKMYEMKIGGVEEEL